MSSSVRLSAQLIIVTGLSGSGKSIAIRQLEDSGYYCLDNLPADFLQSVVTHLAQHGLKKLAVSIDARSQVNLETARGAMQQLAAAGCDVRVLFLTASTPELVRRFPKPAVVIRSPVPKKTARQTERSTTPSVWSENFWHLPHNTLTSSIPQGFCPTHYATGCARLPKPNSR